MAQNADSVDSQTQQRARASAGYLAGRNDAILALLYDNGLRVGELVALDVEMLDFGEGVLVQPDSWAFGRVKQHDD